MLPRRREDLIQDLLDISRETLWHLEGVDLDEFLEDKGLQRIIERTLEILGEAATRLGDDLPPIDVAWGDLKGMRTILAHGYFKVEPRTVYVAATRDVPDLLVKLQAYLDAQDKH